MKRIITWLLVVSLCLVPVEFSQAGEDTYSVVLQGLSSSADIAAIVVSTGVSVESYGYSSDGLVTDEEGNLTLLLPTGYAQIEVTTSEETFYYVGTVAATGENTWTPVTEQLSLGPSDVVISGNESTVSVGTLLSADSRIAGLHYSWQRMAEAEPLLWEEVGTGSSYVVKAEDLGCMLRLVITKENAYGKKRVAIADTVKKGDFSMIPKENQSYVFNNCEKSFSYTVSDASLSGFQIEYRKSGETEYSKNRPFNAGIYDVKIVREADSSYGYYEKEFPFVMEITPFAGKLLSEFQCGDAVFTGSPVNLVYTIKTTFDNLPVVFSYKKKGEDDSTYTLTAPTEAGNYIIKASVAETENYGADEAISEFSIVAPDNKGENTVEPSPVYHLLGNQANLSLKVGAVKNLGFTSDGTIIYSSTDADIVTVDGTGKVTAKKPGTAFIHVRVNEDTTLQATFSVKVCLSTPTKLKKSKVTKNSVKLSWKKCSGAVSYTVYRATKKNGTYKKIKTVKKTTYTDKKLKKKKTYYYKIVANAGSLVYSSAKSSALRVKTKK